MRQDRKPEAGKQKHNHGEHRVRIFDRDTCSLVCFVLQCGRKRYLTPQLLGFSFVLDRIVHLPVPSENVSRHGKEIIKIFPCDDEPVESHGCARRQTLERKIEDTNLAKSPPKPKNTSEETTDGGYTKISNLRERVALASGPAVKTLSVKTRPRHPI